VAVIQIVPSLVPPDVNFNNFDFDVVPVSSFATEQEAKSLSISESVVSAGLLPAFPGSARNYPLFKFGNISNVPSEPLPVPCHEPGPKNLVYRPRMMNLWLLAINLVPGNSGSPIFFAPAGANGVMLGAGRAMLIGLQSIAILGADVAGMTPAESIFRAITNIGLEGPDFYRGAPPVLTP